MRIRERRIAASLPKASPAKSLSSSEPIEQKENTQVSVGENTTVSSEHQQAEQPNTPKQPKSASAVLLDELFGGSTGDKDPLSMLMQVKDEPVVRKSDKNKKRVKDINSEPDPEIVRLNEKKVEEIHPRIERKLSLQDEAMMALGLHHSDIIANPSAYQRELNEDIRLKVEYATKQRELRQQEQEANKKTSKTTPKPATPLVNVGTAPKQGGKISDLPTRK